MQEANQEVPDWLTRYASRASFGGGKKRSGGQTGGNVELSSHAQLSCFSSSSSWFSCGQSSSRARAELPQLVSP
ncbi:BnaA02g17920D [Brassica napus]|uniref:BnaA02g17920D protein n=2 Tax=Brassica TaxID=3705 RepID=A0A078I9C8_BRANA|nr:BnaA02g17920D [Brassica napus]